MSHQNCTLDGTSDEKSLCFLSVFHNVVEGAFCVASHQIGSTPKMKNGAPRDELKNGRGRVWVIPYDGGSVT